MVNIIRNQFQMKLLEEMVNESKFQILEYDTIVSNNKYKKDVKKQVRVILEKDIIKIDEQKIGCIKGQVWQRDIAEIDCLRKIFVTETTYNIDGIIRLEGLGEVLTTQINENFLLIELQDEEIIIDRDNFIACEDNVDIKAFFQKDSRTYLENLEARQKLRLKGAGIVVLNIPVCKEKLIRYKLFKDKLIVNSDNVLLYTGNIKFEVNTLKKDKIKIKENKIYDIYSGIGDIWLYQLEQPIISGIYDNND